MSYQCLLFDLDGTLVDSRADLINSVNLTLAELGRETLPGARVINFVGEGARLLVERDGVEHLSLQTMELIEIYRLPGCMATA